MNRIGIKNQACLEDESGHKDLMSPTKTFKNEVGNLAWRRSEYSEKPDTTAFLANWITIARLKCEDCTRSEDDSCKYADNDEEEL